MIKRRGRRERMMKSENNMNKCTKRSMEVKLGYCDRQTNIPTVLPNNQQTDVHFK